MATLTHEEGLLPSGLLLEPLAATLSPLVVVSLAVVIRSESSTKGIKQTKWRNSGDGGNKEGSDQQFQDLNRTVLTLQRPQGWHHYLDPVSGKRPAMKR
jgi:hypothetical protein